MRLTWNLVLVVGACLLFIPLLYSAQKLKLIKFGGEEVQVLRRPEAAIVRSVAHRTPAHTVSPSVNRSEPQVNPGCLERRLNKYRAVDTGRVYHHPPIIHYIKLSQEGRQQSMSINFREYTGVLSVYKFLHPETIMFHTYTSMGGKYWDKMKEWKGVEIVVNKIDPVHEVGGKHITWIQHEADYVKLRELLRYGGISLDFDVIIVNATRLKREQSLSECVISEEGDYINVGFQSCIKDSPYIRKWVEGYEKDYRPRLWLHNGSFKPAHILLDKESGVCYNVHLDDTVCIHPNWGKKREWLKRNGVQWSSKTAAHYFVKDGIANDDERILLENHSLADLLRYVHET